MLEVVVWCVPVTNLRICKQVLINLTWLLLQNILCTYVYWENKINIRNYFGKVGQYPHEARFIDIFHVTNLRLYIHKRTKVSIHFLNGQIELTSKGAMY